MNKDHVRRSITELGYNAHLEEAESKLIVEFAVGGRTVKLAHTFPDHLLRVPKFYLLKGHGFGKLAHVLTSEYDEGGEVCIADPSSTAVNTDRPELAYRATVEEHVRLLSQLIDDPVYNRIEQLREFDAHWRNLCKGPRSRQNELFVVWNGDEVEKLHVKPPRTNSGRNADSSKDMQTRPVALASSLVNHPNLVAVRDSAEWKVRQIVGKALAAPLNDLEPAPMTPSDLLPWFFSIVDHMDDAGRHQLQRLHKNQNYEFWLVFLAPIPDGETMFAIRWRSRSKCPFPISVEEAEAAGWTATPHVVRSPRRLWIGRWKYCPVSDIGRGGMPHPIRPGQVV